MLRNLIIDLGPYLLMAGLFFMGAMTLGDMSGQVLIERLADTMGVSDTIDAAKAKWVRPGWF